MKRIVFSFLFIALWAVFGSINASAQEGEKGQLWFCWEATVHPELQMEFVKLQFDFHSKFKEAGFSYPLYTWTDRHFGFYFFYPVDSYDDKSKIYRELWDVIPTWGEDNLSMMWEAVESHRTYFLQSLDEISFTPENQRLDELDMPYAYWDILHVTPAKEIEFVELMKKLMALQQAQNFDDPVQMLTSDIRYEGSVYIAALKGKDPVDMRLQNQKMWGLLGDEGGAIFQKMLTLLQKRESKEFWYLEDLTYIPDF